jgi:hypothetical protein
MMNSVSKVIATIRISRTTRRNWVPTVQRVGPGAANALALWQIVTAPA